MCVDFCVGKFGPSKKHATLPKNTQYFTNRNAKRAIFYRCSNWYHAHNDYLRYSPHFTAYFLY